MDSGFRRAALRAVLWALAALTLGAVVLGVYVFAVNRSDDPIDPVVAKAMAEPAQLAPATEASAAAVSSLHQLVGLHATGEADPIAFGRDWIAKAVVPPKGDGRRPNMPEQPGMNWPVCAAESCYALFVDQPDRLAERSEKFKVLRTRFGELMRTTEFSDAPLPMDSLPTNLHAPWVRAHELELGAAVLAIRAGRRAEGLKSLLALSVHTRLVMAGSRTLAGKRATVAAHKRMTVVLSQLLNDDPVLGREYFGELANILEPTRSANDFRAAQAHEIRILLAVLGDLSSTESLAKLPAPGLDGFQIRNFTLPNATRNLLVRWIEPAMKHAKWNPDSTVRNQFDLENAQRALLEDFKVDGPGKLRNMGGRHLLWTLWEPAVHREKSLALELDDLLTLVLVQAAFQLGSVPPEEREAFLREKSIHLLPFDLAGRVLYDAALSELQISSRTGKKQPTSVKIPEA